MIRNTRLLWGAPEALLGLFLVLGSLFSIVTALPVDQDTSVSTPHYSVLGKRDCTQVGDSNDWSCDDVRLAGVDSALKDVDSWGICGKLEMNVFYTDMKERTAREWGNCQARNWDDTFKNEPEGDKTKDDWTWVLWGRMVDLDVWNKMYSDASSTLQTAAQEASGKTVTKANLIKALDPLGKHYSQAYAERAVGKIVILASDDKNPDNDINGWDQNRAWGGWEFPALTRNTEVTEIFRVDPATDNEPKSIWKQGDAKTSYEPKGKREDSDAVVTVED